MQHKHVFFLRRRPLSLTVCYRSTLPTARGITVEQILFTRGLDPVTQVRRARFLTDAGDLL